jgi:hypothetical protein
MGAAECTGELWPGEGPGRLYSEWVNHFRRVRLFYLPANGAANLPAIALGATTLIPSSLSITPSSISLTGAGQTVQLLVTATYPDDSKKHVTASSTGTNYTSEQSR